MAVTLRLETSELGFRVGCTDGLASVIEYGFTVTLSVNWSASRVAGSRSRRSFRWVTRLAGSTSRRPAQAGSGRDPLERVGDEVTPRPRTRRWSGPQRRDPVMSRCESAATLDRQQCDAGEHQRRWRWRPGSRRSHRSAAAPQPGR